MRRKNESRRIFDLLVARLLEARALCVLDVAGALVLLGALAGEDRAR